MAKTYSEKLKDPQWQKKRLELLASSGFKCESCGDTEETLNVHHVYYERDLNPWEYPDEAYLVLCSRCHEKWHKSKETMDKALCHVRVDHLNHLQDIVCRLAEMGPNETMLFYNLVSGYYEIVVNRSQSPLFGG